jgi:peroxiredoxin
VFIGVAIPGESPNQIEIFKETYGITFDQWIDNNFNYEKLIEPGGRSFPLEVVIDKDGFVTYLANNYIPGAAIKAVQEALKN